MRQIVDASDSKASEVAYWNYRMMLADNGEWGIREVFYDKDDVIVGWTSYPCVAWGETPEELTDVLARMQKAADRPPLVETDLPNGAFKDKQLVEVKSSDGIFDNDSSSNDGSA
jgi:hypothetical protein